MLAVTPAWADWAHGVPRGEPPGQGVRVSLVQPQAEAAPAVPLCGRCPAELPARLDLGSEPEREP